jgi:hypothetical protein
MATFRPTRKPDCANASRKWQYIPAYADPVVPRGVRGENGSLAAIEAGLPVYWLPQSHLP